MGPFAAVGEREREDPLVAGPHAPIGLDDGAAQLHLGEGPADQAGPDGVSEEPTLGHRPEPAAAPGRRRGVGLPLADGVALGADSTAGVAARRSPWTWSMMPAAKTPSSTCAVRTHRHPRNGSVS